MKKMTERLLWVWIMFLVLDAPLRFLFISAGVPSAIYVKDMLIAALLMYVLLTGVLNGKTSKTFLTMLAVMVYGMVVGFFGQLAPMQVLFGFKIFLSLLIGFVAVRNLGVERSFFIRMFRVVVPVVLTGLALEIFYDLPWKGLEYQAFGTSIEASRDWTMFGLPRLSGFGRASFETAAVLFSFIALYLGARVMEIEPRHWWSNKYENLLLTAAVAGIVVTTSKAAILAVLFLFLFYAVFRLYRRCGSRVKLLCGMALKTTLCILFLYSVVPPVIAYVRPTALSEHLITDDLIVLAVTGSYVDRIENAWPIAYDLMSAPHHYASGRGIGGIGSPQLYFEADRYNSADNIWVYLFIDFGLFVLVAIALYLAYQLYRSRLENRGTIFLYMLLISLFAFGATGNFVESPALTVSAGFLLAMWKREAKDVC